MRLNKHLEGMTDIIKQLKNEYTGIVGTCENCGYEYELKRDFTYGKTYCPKCHSENWGATELGWLMILDPDGWWKDD